MTQMFDHNGEIAKTLRSAIEKMERTTFIAPKGYAEGRRVTEEEDVRQRVYGGTEHADMRALDFMRSAVMGETVSIREHLTAEKMRDIWKEMQKEVADGQKYGPGIFQRMYQQMPVVAIPVFDSPYMTETETYTEEIPRTLRERWIDPFVSFENFTTMPFEPWKKVETVTCTREVPSKKILRTAEGVFCHPAMRQEIMRAIKTETP